MSDVSKKTNGSDSDFLVSVALPTLAFLVVLVGVVWLFVFAAANHYGSGTTSMSNKVSAISAGANHNPSFLES